MPQNDQAQPTAKPGHRLDLAFHRMVEKLPAAAYTCDADGLVAYFNQRAAELWGRVPKLKDPADLEQLLARLVLSLAGE